MSVPAGSPHPAASARIPPKLGGAASSGAAAPAAPCSAPHQQNGEAGGPGVARGLVPAGSLRGRSGRAGRGGWVGACRGRAGAGAMGGAGRGQRGWGWFCGGPEARGRWGRGGGGREPRCRLKPLRSCRGAGSPCAERQAGSRGAEREVWGGLLCTGGQCPSRLGKIALISAAQRARCLERNLS